MDAQIPQPPLRKLGPLVKPALVLAEGSDDERWFRHLIRHLALTDIIDVLNVGGRDAYPRFLQDLQKASGFGGLVALLVTRDADESAEKSLKSLAGSLERADFAPPTDQFLFSSGTPRVAIALVGSRNAITTAADIAGELEDMCLQLLRNHALVDRCVQPLLNCAAEAGISIPLNGKAKLHAALAIGVDKGGKSSAGLPVGVAMERGCFDHEHPALEPYRKILQELAAIASGSP